MSISLEDFEKVKAEVMKKPYAHKNITASPKDGLSYLRYRLKRPLIKSRYLKYQKDHPNEPWLCPDAIKILNVLSSYFSNGLEYGSGRSTSYFAPFFEKYVSIEHEEDWYQNVKEKIADLPQVEYYLVKPENEAPQQHLSSEEQVFFTKEEYPISDEVFTSYTNFILSYEDGYFDFILIDGRARRTCALNSIEKLKSGGILILDNSERKRYQKVHQALRSWPKIETTTGLTDTTIWRKP